MRYKKQASGQWNPSRANIGARTRPVHLTRPLAGEALGRRGAILFRFALFLCAMLAPSSWRRRHCVQPVRAAIRAKSRREVIALSYFIEQQIKVATVVAYENKNRRQFNSAERLNRL